MKIVKYISTPLLTAFSISCFAGAWGIGSFENDSALDWSYELEAANTLLALETAFNSVKGGGYIEVDACSSAIAAAEIISAIKNKDYSHLPKNVKSWAMANSSIINERLILSAQNSLSICTNESNSELAQLWAESQNKEWQAYVFQLSSRLK